MGGLQCSSCVPIRWKEEYLGSGLFSHGSTWSHLSWKLGGSGDIPEKKCAECSGVCHRRAKLPSFKATSLLWTIGVMLYLFLPFLTPVFVCLFVVVENENHCDFVKLREMLIRVNMEDLREQTHSRHYELYRRCKLEEMGFKDTDPDSKPFRLARGSWFAKPVSRRGELVLGCVLMWGYGNSGMGCSSYKTDLWI